jgi:hypothetical protein
VSKKTVPVDDNLLSHLHTAADFEMHGPQQSIHDKHVVVAADLEWLIGKMATSKQFTPEQQEVLRQILTNAKQFKQRDEVQHES